MISANFPAHVVLPFNQTYVLIPINEACFHLTNDMLNLGGL